MSASLSTKEKLLSIIDELEILSKKISENVASMKHEKFNEVQQRKLIHLLLLKKEELEETLKLVGEQAKIEEQITFVKNEVEKHDQYIRHFEKQLKEAEEIIATANFQAKQKLDSVEKAEKRPVSSDDLIKYAHIISSSEAVSAPSSWQPGDPRRPYPTDIDMRLGLLSRYNDPTSGGSSTSQSANLQDVQRSDHSSNTGSPVSLPNQFSWHPSNDIQMNVTTLESVTRNHGKDTPDVEIMSTDSSSSSSSDSQ